MRANTTTALLLATLVGSAALAAGGCAGDDVATGDEQNIIESKPRRFAPDQIDAEDNWQLWSEYCIADREMTQRPMPNYENPLVMEAANQLSRVAEHSFALYYDMRSHHQTDVPEQLEGTVTEKAHQFLGYLCGEFRDRATMVKAKLEWVANMNYLDDEEIDYDPAGDPWQQMQAKDYKPYLSLSHELWQAKRDKLSEEGRRYMQVGEIQADTPVPPQTICETKYMFAEYVKVGKHFDDLETFEAGYQDFREQYCNIPEDEDWYYDFRGDSNIKPNSPESNGMIWASRTITRQCDARKSQPHYQQAREQSSVDDAVCQRYFRYPFTTRWNAARAGLATWVLVDPNASGLDSNSQFTVYPFNAEMKAEGETYLFGDQGPFLAKNGSGESIELLDGYIWFWGAFGLPEMHENNKESIQRLIQLAVDRHTDWYDSGYDDQMEYKRYSNDQAYSPFVASSYEMNESDAFVSPCYTVPCNWDTDNAEDYKHWMFVFKVHKDNWYTPERINAEDVPIPNFDRYWFDETSFGNSSLANSERAWDRLGTALEDELAGLLYLHNLPSG